MIKDKNGVIKIVGIKDINKALVNTLKQMLGKEIKIISSDVLEPIIRPSLKIVIDSIKAKRFNNFYIERTIYCDIYYFCSDKQNYKIENIEIQGKIEEIFYNNLKVNDNFYIPIKDLEFDTEDTILTCSFELYMLTKEQDNDKTEVMEKIEYISKGS